MKKKILAGILLAVMLLTSLTSCTMTDLDMFFGSVSKDETPIINNIYVEGGDNYENINITSTADKNLLAASKAVLSVVSIRTTKSAGSGVIYELDKTTGDALVITNFHVVYDEANDNIYDEIYLFLYGMEYENYAIKAEYVGGSMTYDLAVLRVSASPVLVTSPARAVEIANSDEVSILETAIAIGNPEAGGISATVGSISVDNETITIGFETEPEETIVELRVMRTDAAVNGGNSGGGLFNDKGELIGIVNARSSDMTSQNIGYALPSNHVVAVAENIKYYSKNASSYKVHKCMLGIEVAVTEVSARYDETTGKIAKLEKVEVTKIDRFAGAYGYLEDGDVINWIEVDGLRCDVTRLYQVVDTMLYARVGSRVTINVTRNGATVSVTIPVKPSMIETVR